MNYRDIEHGWDVYSSDGEKVGDVREVGENYILIEKGFLFSKERYVPVSAIGRVEHDRVHLNLTKDQVTQQDWDRAPETMGGVREPVERGRRAESERTVELREEELRARKQQVQTGEVGIRKEVVEEEKTIDVPVTREEVVVERRPVDRQPAESPVGEGESLRVPIREEEVSVEKRPVVTEEVSIGKQAVQDTEQVSETVRREEARVEREGDVEVRGDEPRR